jgi:hypothetical protein
MRPKAGGKRHALVITIVTSALILLATASTGPAAGSTATRSDTISATSGIRW